MGNPKIEDAIGVVDGINKDFSTPTDYTAGSLEAWINGVLVRKQDIDGFTETGSNTFQMGEPVRTGDVLRVFYIDTAPVIGPDIEELHGTLVATESFTGNIASDGILSGALYSDQYISGQLIDLTGFSGSLVDTGFLTATILECDVGGTIVKIAQADCPASVDIGDWVYITGPQVNDRWQIDTASSADPAKYPAAGIVISKATTTTAQVQWFGEMEGVLTSLAIGTGQRVIWLGADGKTRQSPGTEVLRQALGTVIDTDTVLIEPDFDAEIIGSLTDSDEFVQRTTSNITMVVDHVGGTSPADGTIINSQTEYDALGSDLKYLQDALDILPSTVDHFITVSMVAGDHYSKPGSGGDVPVFLRLSSFEQSPRREETDIAKPISSPGIIVQGATTTTESGIAGLFTTGAVFTRSSGSWVAGSLRGEWVTVASGAGAGTTRLIADNTTTSVTLARGVGSVGIATIDVVDNATRCLAKLDGGAATKGIYDNFVPGDNTQYWFENIIFGESESIPFGETELSGHDTELSYCDWRGGMDIRNADAFVHIKESEFVVIPAAVNPILVGENSTLHVTGSIVRGERTGGTETLLRLKRESISTIEDTWFIAEGSHSGYCLNIEESAVIDILGDTTYLKGNSTSTGIFFEGPGEISCDGSLRLQLDDHAVAVRVLQAELRIDGVSGSGNNTAWVIDDGSSVNVGILSTLTGTNFILLDGYTLNPVDITASGDEVVGPEGSIVLLY